MRLKLLEQRGLGPNGGLARSINYPNMKVSLELRVGGSSELVWGFHRCAAFIS